MAILKLPKIPIHKGALIMKWTNNNITSQQLLKFLEDEKQMPPGDIATAIGSNATFLNRVRKGNDPFEA